MRMSTALSVSIYKVRRCFSQALMRIAAVAIALNWLLPSAPCQATEGEADLFAKTFDTHWERLRDDYPYFELYGVDWDAERAEHRPRAIAAANETEFAWEVARLISALPDPHVSFRPSMDTVVGKWSMPEVKTQRIERRVFVLNWPEGADPKVPAFFEGVPYCYPEIIRVAGEKPVGAAEILVSGPLGTKFEIDLRWPDGTETKHELQRPAVSNLPPPKKHFGERWLIGGRVGSVGYIRVQTFNPEMGTLGPDGKMTTMLRAALKELNDTDSLILDFRGNGGGQVPASDPFLGHFVKRRQVYAWGRAGGKKRIIRPRSPRYRGKVVALVDARSASGGEWAAFILRNAGRAIVIGERTSGAEAAVSTSTGPDGSTVKFSGWPMIEPGKTPFQEVGIELDHDMPLTIARVQEIGFEEALAHVNRSRFAKALEVLGAPAGHLDALIELANSGEE